MDHLAGGKQGPTEISVHEFQVKYAPSQNGSHNIGGEIQSPISAMSAFILREDPLCLFIASHLTVCFFPFNPVAK